MSTPVLAARSLTKIFPGPPPTPALRDCSLEVDRGDFIAITGASGSGKTTLLSLLGLLDVPTSGTLAINGHDTSKLSEADRSGIRATHLGYVFQSFHLLGYRTVLDNVQIGLIYQRVRRRTRLDRARAVIERVGLDHRVNAPCSNLSGGERQRVAIARALIREPALILCDEPTGNLDSATTQQVLELLHQLHRDGSTLMMITHDGKIARQAPRRFHMSDGHLSELSHAP